MKRTPLRRVSKKHAAALKTYSKLRKEYLREHPGCEVCTKNAATDIHHKEGRGPNLNRADTWLAVCRPCHHEIHTRPSKARERGLLK